MSNKRIKIAVNVLMLSAVIFSYVRWTGEPTWHVVAGFVCAIFFAVHFLLNRKMFVAFGKGMGKLNIQTKMKYLIDWLLLIIWGLAILSGLLALLSYSGAIESVFNVRRIHGIFCRIGGVLIV
ncbi:MAG: hypothetical protein LBJ21_09650, partial [Acidobacteriota bacterium]|nr:hypothetical protein [Acidobacteriota bacterium]